MLASLNINYLLVSSMITISVCVGEFARGYDHKRTCLCSGKISVPHTCP